MASPASCFLYARPKERKALHFCRAWKLTETVLYRADPSALKQTALGAPFAPWFRIPLGTLLMKHCWVSGGKLYGLVAVCKTVADGPTYVAGEVYELDDIEINADLTPVSDEQSAMLVKLALAGAGGGRVTKMELIAQDADATITMDGPRRRWTYDEVVGTELQIRTESGSMPIRRFESQITTDDPSMAIVTYTSTKIDAALLIARWSQERKQ